MAQTNDRIEKKVRLKAPRERVWHALNDPAVLMRSIPGCEEVQPVSDTEPPCPSLTVKVIRCDPAGSDTVGARPIACATSDVVAARLSTSERARRSSAWVRVRSLSSVLAMYGWSASMSTACRWTRSRPAAP